MLEGGQRRLAWIGFGAYLAVLLALTLAPAPPEDAEQQSPFWLNLRPFDTITRALSSEAGPAGIALMIGNVAAFVPLGAFVPLLKERASWRMAAGAGLGLSVGIESAQLGLSLLLNVPYRYVDVDDVILNTSGAAVGYAAARLFVSKD